MDILNSLRHAEGVCDAGACAYRDLLPLMKESARIGAERLISNARTVFCAVFPYHAAERTGNLSLYARGRDYHAVAADALEPLVQQLRTEMPTYHFAALTDDSPLPEVEAAARAGLGVIGRNGLLIHPVYGSYLFIGTILTDFDCNLPSAQPASCIGCGACERLCPVGLDKSRCLSALTQKGGDLTAEEAALVRAHPLIWGCDLCQLCCPMNRNAADGIPALTQDPIDFLAIKDLDGLTRRAFLEKYPDRAFTWKGPRPLLRNLRLKEEPQEDTHDSSAF